MTPLLWLLLLAASAPAEGLKLLPAGWEALSFKKVPKHTVYAWEDGVLHAVSSGAASGLVYRLDRRLSDAPLLRWRWRVAGTVPGGDERFRRGDDYAARVYVLFKYDPARASRSTRVKYALAKALFGEYPPQSGLNYIWANRLPKGEAVRNPYADRVMMIAVRSGKDEAGRWLSEERNVLSDYRRFYGQDPPPLAGVAVMTDSDDTGASAEAWYADLELAP